MSKEETACYACLAILPKKDTIPVPNLGASICKDREACVKRREAHIERWEEHESLTLAPRSKKR